MILFPEIQCWYLIQARLGSTRLPEKVLMPIGKRTILGNILHKLLSSGISPAEILVATTNLPEDRALVGEAMMLGVGHFQGSEDDVLGRFVGAIPQAKDCDILIRLTADNPFVDIHLLKDLVQFLLEGNFDYAAPRGCALGSGAEVMKVKALRTAHQRAFQPWHREHVTPYIRENPDQFKAGYQDVVPDRSTFRLTIDTEADLALARSLYGIVGDSLLAASQEEICRVLDQHPEIRSLNHDVEQKKQ